MKLKQIKKIVIKKRIALEHKDRFEVLQDYCKLGIILEGERGIAKTSIIRSMENLFDTYREFDASHIVDPFTLTGVPLEKGIDYGYLNNMNGTKLIFIDEVNKSQKSVLSILNSILTNDSYIQMGSQKIDISNRIIVGAQNPSNERYEFSSTIEDESFLSRFVIYPIEADREEAKNYFKGIRKKEDLKLDDLKNIEVKYPENWGQIVDYIVDRMVFTDLRRTSYTLGAILLYLNGVEKDINFLYSELEPIFKKDGVVNREDYTPILQEIISFLKELENIDYSIILEKRYERLNNEVVNILILKAKDLKNEEIEEILEILKKDKNEIVKHIPENLYKNLINSIIKEDATKNSKKKIKQKIEDAINNIKI